SDPPFSRNERTIIRPNPGGRRPSSPAAPVAPAQPPQYPPPPGATPAAAGTPMPGSANPDDWVRTAPQPVAPDAPQQALIPKRDVPAAANETILLEASSPILLLLGRLRVSLMRANFANLMSQVADAIEEFEHKVRAASVPENQARLAKYAVCATA